MKIFLIRHGESIQNSRENIENLPDQVVTLTEKGQQQARECGEFLKDYCEKNNVDLSKSTLFVSPFRRARDTAKIINESLHIDDVKEDVLLIERQFGLYDGLTFNEREKYKQSFDYSNWMYENGGYFYTKYPLGESPLDVAIRARIFMDTLFRDMYNGVENFFIVSHGVYLTIFQMAYFHYSPEWFNTCPNMQNCSVKLIDKQGKNRSVDKDYIFKGPVPPTKKTIK